MEAVKERPLTELEAKACLVIVSKEVSTKRLAEALGVSTMTAARTVAGLRKKGVKVVAVRDRKYWHYEIPNWKDRERERWRRSRLRRMIGFIKTWKPMPGKSEDDIIYGED